jgi:glycosyltransferase involved in cell wall biosynthesis
MRKPAVSVILCTYDPDLTRLNWALESIYNQTLGLSYYEFILVDNNSRPPLAERPGMSLPHSEWRITGERRQGLAFARVRGILASSAPIIIFVDDDNALDPDYLETALEIARTEPAIGCFGGESRGVLETPLPGWKRKLLPYIGVRDYGEEPITSNHDEWGEWEPIGAGMVCRKDVAEEFVKIVETRPSACRLGRAGRELMSGEDSLIAHAAYRLGYSCSYQPRLKLFHWIPKERTTFGRLAKTVEGHGRSHAVLRTVKGQRVVKPSLPDVFRHLILRYRERVCRDGIGAGTVNWFWDYGYTIEARKIGN